MSTQTNRQWARQALLALPEKERNRSLTNKLARFAEIAEQSRDSLQIALNSANFVKSVFGDSSFSSLETRVRSAAGSARACQRELAKGMDAVAKKTFEDRVMTIKESASASTKPVLEVWQDNLATGVRPYEQVAKVAADRGLPGGPELNKRLSELLNRSTLLPQDEKDATALSLKLGSLPNEVKALGLTGKAGDFLVAAAEGRASPRDLENAEIRDLLDRYKLWDSLLVSLGSRK